MLKKRTVLFVLCLFIALVSGVGCDDDVTEVDERALLEEMEQDVLDYVGEPQCDNLTDCRYIEFGDKPCGGPWYYLIYSISSVDSGKLENMVLEYNEYNEELNLNYNWISDCSVPNTPNLDCLNGLCVDLGYGPE